MALKGHIWNDCPLKKELTEDAGTCCPWGQKSGDYDLFIYLQFLITALSTKTA